MKFKKNDEYKTIKKATGKIEIKPVLKPSMPKSVKIDNVMYDVIQKDVVILNDQVVNGQIAYKDSYIEVSTDQSESNKKIVITHETVHGITVERDIRRLIPAEHYEKVVSEITNGFIQIIRDNPDLIDYIRDEVTPRSIK